jgi:hypothetical protein
VTLMSMGILPLPGKIIDFIVINIGLGIDAHCLKIQGEGKGHFCQILGGGVYRGCENCWGRVQLFGVLLHFY